jgi:hypothetical protein
MSHDVGVSSAELGRKPRKSLWNFYSICHTTRVATISDLEAAILNFWVHAAYRKISSYSPTIYSGKVIKVYRFISSGSGVTAKNVDGGKFSSVKTTCAFQVPS